MPEVSRFYGIIIKIFYDDHNRISFTRDGTRMEIRHPRGAAVENQPPQGVTVYRILAEGPRALRMQIVGETRTTERGEPVVRDFITRPSLPGSAIAVVRARPT